MKKLTLLFIFIVGIYGCNYNPTDNNYYANFKTEFYTLTPNKWIPVQGTNIQWFQEFPLPTAFFGNFDYVGVMVYYLNQHQSWEALPSTRIFWTENDVVYSDELWFSHNLEFLYIDYRNTVPGTALPPRDQMKIKAVYFNDEFYDSKQFKDINWNDYNDVKSKLNLKD